MKTINNAEIIATAAALAGISCEVHTYKGWQARGFNVKRGEHKALEVSIWKHTNKPTKRQAAKIAAGDLDPESVSNFYLSPAYFFTADQVERATDAPKKAEPKKPAKKAKKTEPAEDPRQAAPERPEAWPDAGKMTRGEYHIATPQGFESVKGYTFTVGPFSLGVHKKEYPNGHHTWTITDTKSGLAIVNGFGKRADAVADLYKTRGEEDKTALDIAWEITGTEKYRAAVSQYNDFLKKEGK